MQSHEQLTETPSDSAKHESIAAKPALCEPAPTIDSILDELSRISRRRTGEIRQKMLTATALGLLPITLIAYAYAVATGYGYRDEVLVTGWVIPLAVLLLATAFGGSRRQYELAERLAQYDDPRAIGRLIAASTWADERASSAARAALIRMLPGSKRRTRHFSHRRIEPGWRRSSTIMPICGLAGGFRSEGK